MKKNNNDHFVFRHVYPRFRYLMTAGRKSYHTAMELGAKMSKRPTTSSVIPDNYTVCNTSTIDSDFSLNVIEGSYPEDLKGSMYIAQCLGTPEAFMVGDTNIVRMDFHEDGVDIKNRMMWTPAAIAKHALEDTRHRFDYMGLMFLSPGLGMYSYTEGMYLLPDGRLAVTSDVDRPWVIDKDSLKATTPIGKREDWLPMMSEEAGDVMGQLFAGYSNSHVIYPDMETGETFLVSYQYKQKDGSHPVKLMSWNGHDELNSWSVIDEDGQDIEIKQSIHELIFTRDYILLADTAFVAGAEMLTPWKNAPLPNTKTIVYIVDRREMIATAEKVRAKKVVVDEACIHLIAEYENPDDQITVYMLHTPATNTAEIMKSFDRNLEGELFADHVTGYGTLPVLDLSSIGKHVIDMQSVEVASSNYISELPFCFGPYLYTYMGRQYENFRKQDLYVMFKGFDKQMLPERIYHAYKDVDDRRLAIEEMVEGEGISANNSICRIDTDSFTIADSYMMPDRVLLYTISCMESEDQQKGYVLAGVVTDESCCGSSGHEYWLFDGADLSKGPVCKMSHEELNNSTLFHTVYLPERVEDDLKGLKKDYHVDLEEDYPQQELEKWEPVVGEVFKDLVWPYFDRENKVGRLKVEKKLADFTTIRIKEHFGKEFLIGESYVDDPARFVNSMICEAERMWKTTGWKTEYDKMGLKVESKPICGPLEASGVLVTRSSGVVFAPADETFKMLISPEGYAVIDPVSNPDDHKIPPLETYEWKAGARLEAAIAKTSLPMMPSTEFVVMNGIDEENMVFVSKSILHDKVPGGSKYSDYYDACEAERALNTFAIKVQPAGKKRCRITCINYADMAGKTGAGMNNLVNTKLFFPPLYKRIAKKMKEIMNE